MEKDILMKTTLYNQFKQERKAWERSLEFFKQENVLLKYRLSEMVDNNEEKKFLQMAEHFQNEFILKDERLNMLKKDLQMFSDKFIDFQNEKAISRKLMANHDEIRNQILELEKSFLHLSKEFNERMLHSSES